MTLHFIQSHQASKSRCWGFWRESEDGNSPWRGCWVAALSVLPLASRIQKWRIMWKPAEPLHSPEPLCGHAVSLGLGRKEWAGRLIWRGGRHQGWFPLHPCRGTIERGCTPFVGAAAQEILQAIISPSQNAHLSFHVLVDEDRLFRLLMCLGRSWSPCAA